MTEKIKRFRFIKDDDGHTYLIEADQVKKFEKWVAAGPYWENYRGPDFSDAAIGCNPNCYTFTDPKCD